MPYSLSWLLAQSPADTKFLFFWGHTPKQKDVVNGSGLSYYLVLLICLLLATASKAQTYSIKSLDGSKAFIKLYYKPFSKRLIISCAKDKLIIYAYTGPEETNVINGYFLQIKYYKRGGSGIGLGNTLLLCVSHGKVRQAMHIESYSSNLNYSSDSNPERTTQKIIDTRLALDAANSAHVTTYDTLVAGQNQNFKRTSAATKKYTVRFGLTKRVFCNYQKSINATLITFKNNRDIIKKFIGVAPAFQLNNSEYIFVGSNWYIKYGIKKEYLLIE